MEDNQGHLIVLSIYNQSRRNQDSSHPHTVQISSFCLIHQLCTSVHHIPLTSTSFLPHSHKNNPRRQFSTFFHYLLTPIPLDRSLTGKTLLDPNNADHHIILTSTLAHWHQHGSILSTLSAHISLQYSKSSIPSISLDSNGHRQRKSSQGKCHQRYHCFTVLEAQSLCLKAQEFPQWMLLSF